MARGNENDLLADLVSDVEDLKSSSREASERMSSLSDTLAEVGKTISTMARAMAKESERSRNHERLYGRFAKTLIALKDSTDDRYDALETRVERLERGSTRH